jgi:hypothetical protein
MFFKRKQQQTVEPVQIVTGSKIPLNLVFTEQSGVKWYEYQNPMQMPARRAIAAEVATRFAQMNVTKDVLVEFITNMEQKANSGNIVELFHLLTELKFRLDYIGEEQTMLDLATCYFVLEGEDEGDFSEIWKQKKMERLRANGELKDFFVSRAFQLTTNYSELSNTDIHDYLKRNAQANQRFMNLLRRLKLENTLMS